MHCYLVHILTCSYVRTYMYVHVTHTEVRVQQSRYIYKYFGDLMIHTYSMYIHEGRDRGGKESWREGVRKGGLEKEDT